MAQQPPAGQAQVGAGVAAGPPGVMEFWKTKTRPPKAFGGRKGEDFHSWLKRMQQYFALVELPEDKQVATIMLHLEGNAYRAAENIKIEDMGRDAALEALRSYFVPPETEDELRAQFSMRTQGKDELTDAYARDLRLIAGRAFPSLAPDAQELLTIQQFIAGLRDRMTSQRLFLKQCRLLSKAVEFAKLSEAASKAQQLSRRAALSVFGAEMQTAADSNSQGSQQGYRQPNPNGRGGRARGRGTAQAFQRNSAPRRDPATLECYSCHEKGHFARDCPNATSTSHGSNAAQMRGGTSYRPPAQGNRGRGRGGPLQSRCTLRTGNAQQQVHANVAEAQEDWMFAEDDDTAFASANMVTVRCIQATVPTGHVTSGDVPSPSTLSGDCAFLKAAASVFTTIKVNGVTVDTMVDTGSSVCLISERLWRFSTASARATVPGGASAPDYFLGGRLQKLDHLQIIAANGSELAVLGHQKVRIQMGGLNEMHPIVVIARLAQDFIIGNDFLRKHEIAILYGPLVLRTRHEVVPFRLIPPRDGGISSCSARVEPRTAAQKARGRLESPLLTHPPGNTTTTAPQTASLPQKASVPPKASVPQKATELQKASTPKTASAPQKGHEAQKTASKQPTAAQQIAPSVALGCDVTVPAYTGLLVAACVMTSAVSDALLIVEPSIAFEHRTGLLVEPSFLRLTADGQQPLIAVSNYTSTPIKLYKGTKLGAILQVRPDTATTLTAAATATVPTARPVATIEKRDHAGMKLIVEALDLAIPASQRKRLLEILQSYADVVSADSYDVGRTHLITHDINTGIDGPVRQPPRRIPYHMLTPVTAEVQKMLDAHIIRPSTSDWASPIVVAKKKDGAIRICIDYRKLNAITKKDSFPLPRIDDLLDVLKGARVFSTLDLVFGYHNVPMAEQAIPKTAFALPWALYEYTVMPFGLCNSPATFTRLMATVLAGIIGTKCLAYMDDILIFGRNCNEHNARLENVLERLRAANLKLKAEKCVFCKETVTFLGYIVSGDGLAPDPEKVIKVKDWPTPSTVVEVQSFLGLAGYYRRFIQRFAHLTTSLTRLTEKGVPFEWTSECAEAFSALKTGLCSAPILAFPRFEDPFTLDTDASNDAIGAVLSQTDADGKEHPVAYFSKVLNRAERNYSTTRRELLALIKGAEHFRTYLWGRKFTARTDHAALKWLFNFKEPTGQVARWLERLAEYDFEVVHRAGKQHGNADALSRYPIVVVATVETRLGNLTAEIALSQEVDPLLRILGQWLKEGNRPDEDAVLGASAELHYYWAKYDFLRVYDGLLYLLHAAAGSNELVPRLLVPTTMRPRLLETLHSSVSAGHLGFAKTYMRAHSRFYWRGMQADIKNFVHTCTICQQRKSPRKSRALLQPMQTGFPFCRVQLDVLQLAKTARGNQYLLVVVDSFSKWVEAYAMPNQTAETIANLLINEWIARFGCMLQLHSDCGRQLHGKVMKDVCSYLEIDESHTTPYHPQGNGLVERYNRSLIELIALNVERDDEWDDHIGALLMSLRSSVQASTGYTPHFLLFGREMKVPLDILYGSPPDDTPPTLDQFVAKQKATQQAAYEFTRENLATAQKRQKTFYDRRSRSQRFKIGQPVWLHTARPPKAYHKFWKAWQGPHHVVKYLSDVDVLIKGEKKSQITHVDRLKPAYLRKTPVAEDNEPAEVDETAVSTSESSDDDFTPFTYRRGGAMGPPQPPAPPMTSAGQVPSAGPMLSAVPPVVAPDDDDGDDDGHWQDAGRDTGPRLSETRRPGRDSGFPGSPAVPELPVFQKAKAKVLPKPKQTAAARAPERQEKDAPSTSFDDEYEPAALPQPRVRGTADRPLRSTINPPKRLGDYVKPKTGSSSAALLKQVFFLLCLLPRVFAKDTLVMPGYGIAADRCGYVAVQKGDIRFAMVLRLGINVSLYQRVIAPACKTNLASVSVIAEVAETVDDFLYIPGWYASSVRTGDTSGPRHWLSDDVEAMMNKSAIRLSRPADQSRPSARSKRGVLSMIGIGLLGLIGAGSGLFSSFETAQLKREQETLGAHIRSLENFVTDDHADLVKIEKATLSIYEYTHETLGKLAAHIDGLLCSAQRDEIRLAAFAHRQAVIAKIYTDFSASIASIFAGRLSLLALPLRNAEALLEANRELFAGTIYLDSPPALYEFASVMPVFPLVKDAVGYTLHIPRIMQPGLLPLYCVTNIGIIQNDLHLRFVWPPHIIAQPTGNGSLAFLEPSLAKCRRTTLTVYLCQQLPALKTLSEPCFTNGSTCHYEVRAPEPIAWLPTTYGYLVSSLKPCELRRRDEEPLVLMPTHGTLYVQFHEAATLFCPPSLALPISSRTSVVTYVHHIQAPELPSHQIKPFVTPEWQGHAELQQLFQRTEKRTALDRLNDFAANWLFVVLTVLTVIIALMIVALVIMCRFYCKRGGLPLSVPVPLSAEATSAQQLVAAVAARATPAAQPPAPPPTFDKPPRNATSSLYPPLAQLTDPAACQAPSVHPATAAHEPLLSNPRQDSDTGLDF